MAILSQFKRLWSKVPQIWKKELTSFSHTFLASFIFTIGMQMQSGMIPMTKDAIFALAIAALRSALKATFNAVVIESQKTKS